MTLVPRGGQRTVHHLGNLPVEVVAAFDTEISGCFRGVRSVAKSVGRIFMKFDIRDFYYSVSRKSNFVLNQIEES